MPQAQPAGWRNVQTPRRSSWLWGAVATVSVLLLFHVLHETMANHALAIVASGVGGTTVGGVGHRWTNRESSAARVALAGGLGGGVGLLLLHLLPLLH